MARQRIEYLDFAKGFAILSVVIFHYCQPYVFGIAAKAIMVGGTGVHLFFVLSGFGLGLSSRPVDANAFYQNRFVKILIPYYLVVLVSFVINLVLPIYEGDGIYALGGHLLFYKMFDERIMGSFGYHLWFISTIVQFYLLFPLISHIRKKIGANFFLLGSCLMSCAYWVFVSVCGLSEQRIFNSFFLQYLWEFSLGVVFAKLFIERGIQFWNRSTSTLLTVSALSLIIMGYMAFRGEELGRTFNDVPASLAYLSLSALIYSVCQGKFSTVRQAIAYVGRISYEFYLIHMLIFILLNRVLLFLTPIDENIYFALLVSLPASIAIARALSPAFAGVNQRFEQAIAARAVRPTLEESRRLR